MAAPFTKQGGGVAASFTKHHHGSDCLFQPIAEDEADIGQTSGTRAKIMEVSCEAGVVYCDITAVNEPQWEV